MITPDKTKNGTASKAKLSVLENIFCAVANIEISKGSTSIMVLKEAITMQIPIGAPMASKTTKTAISVQDAKIGSIM